MIRADTVDHLSELGVLDMEIFRDAMHAANADPAVLERVTEGGIDGSRRLRPTLELFT